MEWVRRTKHSYCLANDAIYEKYKVDNKHSGSSNSTKGAFSRSGMLRTGNQNTSQSDDSGGLDGRSVHCVHTRL